ncbi:aminoglycoside phosphotransferase family protein [Sphingobacterium sp. SRCM116780]|uniref:phosphotransferase enzyme family protein n=1 Tax=Sphingobacterium sp. SRCM116780 TaxID=2907623 RepID=UPI001F2AF956|nr:aminoglycoside phosphotransferase family protein [Sphingobacterium sp. SRCM116780]UIR56728.1 aminoglycoside phosphotransferase family protein [Sphingobacterium sp. SRCM116780]
MSNSNQINGLKAAAAFSLGEDIISVDAFGSGHINDTFRVTTKNANGKSFLLQRINHHIFQNVEGLMQNIKHVTDHLKSKVAHLPILNQESQVLTIIPTKSNDLYFLDEDGNYWRMFVLIEGTKSYDVVETPKQASEGGKAFGKFQMQLADLDATKIVEVLPNFHNIQFRLDNLNRAIAADTQNRVKDVKDVLDFIFDREERMKTILNLAAKGELPLRITHNDTKFNNVLLDQNDQAQCVIDLDTVMPGYVAYDFGDAIRTIINPVEEDEKDLSKIVLNIPLYAAYAEGYLNEAKEFLTDVEVQSLLEGVFLLPYMQGVRFLTDYIEGDHYFKTKYDNHNLVRTKTQLKLVEEMEKQEQELKVAISSVLQD